MPLTLLLLAAAACPGIPPAPDTGADGDADVETEPDSAPDAETEADSDPDGPDSGGPGGPLSLLVSHAGFVLDRICDIDGDGVGDNAVADLGEPLASVFAAMINNVLADGLENDLRLLLHFPWVDDVAGPNDGSTTLLILSCIDMDDPPDPSDDFSGEEPFLAKPSTLDACGEPRFHFTDAELSDGSFDARQGRLPLPLGDTVIPLSGVMGFGTVGPGGSMADIMTCGHAAIRDLGAEPAPPEMGDLSLLEALVSGGAAFGIPTIPGLHPDIDTDGDGLEQLITDSEGHLEACVDGDGTVIPGRDCWEDPRMQDGFSMTARLIASPARFAGRAPGWEGAVEGECEGGPPSPSLFDP